MKKRNLQFGGRLEVLTRRFVSDVVDAVMRARRTSDSLDLGGYDDRFLRETSIPKYRELRRQTLRRFETDYVTAVLRAASGNISMAARIGHIDRKHLWRLIRRTGVRTFVK